MLDQYLYLHPLTLTSKERKERGITYTPPFIVDFINRRVLPEVNLYDHDRIKIMDFSCGSGVFLIDLLYKLHEITGLSYRYLVENCLYGVDTDQAAIDIANQYLMNLSGAKHTNLVCGDALSMRFDEEFLIVVGNPPYVKIQNIDNRDFLKNYNFISGNTDLYIAFYELGLRHLQENGCLGYISSNSFLKNKSGKLLVDHLLSNRLIRELVDFKEYQVFEDVSTYTCICIAGRTPRISYGYREPRPQQNQVLTEFPDCCYSVKGYESTTTTDVAISSEDTETIAKIENAGQKLGDLFDIRVGLATLADSVFMMGSPIGSERECVIFHKDGRNVYIEADILQRCVKVSRLKNEADIPDTYIIFPYTRGDKASLIGEDHLQNLFPYAYRYLADQRSVLINRDKGKRDYPWYGYGRSQGLNTLWGKKLLITPLAKRPTFIYCDDEETLYLSGYAVLNKPDVPYDLRLAKAVLESQVMQLYIQKRSKKMRSGWNVYSKEFLKNFSIPEFTSAEVSALFNCLNDRQRILLEKYGL